MISDQWVEFVTLLGGFFVERWQKAFLLMNTILLMILNGLTAFRLQVGA